MQPENRKGLGRAYRRIPFAAFILFLFLSALFGSFTFGFIMIVLIVFTIVVMVALEAKNGLKVANDLLFPYMGRNNFLILWIPVFSFISFLLWIFVSSPEEVIAKPIQVTTAVTAEAEAVVETPPVPVIPESENETIVEPDNRKGKSDELTDEELRSSWPEQAALVANTEAIREKYRNYQEGRRFVTNEVAATQEAPPGLITTRVQGWTPWDVRGVVALVLLLITPLYAPFALSDEVRDYFAKNDDALLETNEAPPWGYSRIRSLFGLPRTGGAGKVASATTSVVSRATSSPFWTEMVAEVVSNGIFKIPEMMRRR